MHPGVESSDIKADGPIVTLISSWKSTQEGHVCTHFKSGPYLHLPAPCHTYIQMDLNSTLQLILRILKMAVAAAAQPS